MKPPRKPATVRPGAVSRRSLLQAVPALGVAGLAPAGVVGCASDDGAAAGPRFLHGVASGDPLPDAVILWTRVTPARDQPVMVTWEMASEPTFSAPIATGNSVTDASRDYTVKVDAVGLLPGQTYYYRFAAGERRSPIGRTRTAPLGPVARARFGVASCSSYTQGYFHAYRALAARADLDAVIHLGDYLYEYGPGQFGNTRSAEPPYEIVSLADYRQRHAQYKSDPDLQEVHRQHPFIPVWDDHESANNAWRDGAQNHDPAEGAWTVRKANAQQAYAEWMPIRTGADPARIWRKLRWGDLADLIMLDTRLWARTTSNPAVTAPPPAEDPGATLLGDDQAAWLEGELAAAGPRWKLIGQQVMVANLFLEANTLVNLDQWQGYPASRRRFLDFLRVSGARDVVVLTGDIHSSWANELVLDPRDPAAYDPATGQGALAVELVTPGITSPGLSAGFVPFVNAARPFNPHLRWFDLLQQGYMVLDVTPERTQAAWFLYADIKQRGAATETFTAAWSVARGTTRLLQDPAPSPAPDAPPLAP